MLVYVALNIIVAIIYFTAMGIAIDVGIRANDLKAALDIIEMGQSGWKAASAAGNNTGSGLPEYYLLLLRGKVSWMCSDTRSVLNHHCGGCYCRCGNILPPEERNESECA